MARPLVEIDLKGDKALRRKLGVLLSPTRPMMEELVGFVQGEAKAGTKPHAVDKGTLGNTVKSSLSPEPVPLSARVFTRSGVARTIEEGRKPGKPPPVAPLERWASRHGITENAWKLVQQIRRRGTRGVFFMRKAAEAGQRKAPELIRKAAQQIERNWGR